MMKSICTLISLAMSLSPLPAADLPKAEISNGPLEAKIYLPDAKRGFYQGTRFDWSGVIDSLKFQGHNYYGPWFNKTRPDVHDFIYEGNDIIAGPCSAITGPVDEFAPLGWDDAKPGESFIKIGIGALRKPGDGKYDHYTLYPIADHGKWNVKRHPDSVEFLAPDPATPIAGIRDRPLGIVRNAGHHMHRGPGLGQGVRHRGCIRCDPRGLRREVDADQADRHVRELRHRSRNPSHLSRQVDPQLFRLTHSWIRRRCAFGHRFSDEVGYSPKFELTMSSRLHCVIDDHLTTLYERHLAPTVELL